MQSPADTPAQRGQRGLLAAFKAHHFRETIENAGTDGAGGLRCDVARGKTGATGGDNELGVCCLGAKRFHDCGDIIWNDGL